MAVKIRLSRGGRKSLPFYHIVATDERNSRDGRFIEKLGFWNPISKELKWNTELVNKWLEVGAQPTERVQKLIIKENLGSDKQRAAYTKSFDRKAEIVRKRVEAAAAAKAAEEAAAAAEAEAEAAAE